MGSSLATRHISDRDWGWRQPAGVVRPQRAAQPPIAWPFPSFPGFLKNKLDKPDAQPLQSEPLFMSRNPFAAVLVALLFVNAAVASAFGLVYAFSTRDLRKVQPQAAEIQSRLNVAQALLNDTLEYSRRNPAIDPLLQSLNFKTNAPGAPQPSPKFDGK
jgi:hypothetical protein